MRLKRLLRDWFVVQLSSTYNVRSTPTQLANPNIPGMSKHADNPKKKTNMTDPIALCWSIYSRMEKMMALMFAVY
jgi:hypothetical protein